jgi:protein-tyrosine phosphatase
MAKPVKVLFVCMGNICRSPTGEGVFRHYVARSGYSSSIETGSAGIIDYHAGSLPDPRMRAAASRRGYTLNSIARQVTRADIGAHDLVIAMDRDNLAELESMANGTSNHIRMLGTFLDGAPGNDSAQSVPDPYYEGMAGFDAVLDMIEQACPAILAHCLELLHEQPDDRSGPY